MWGRTKTHLNMKAFIILAFTLNFITLGFALQPPSNDSFYWPAKSEYENLKPGELIRYRSMPEKISGMTGYSSVYELLYRTNDALGNPLAAVTTLIVPTNGSTTKLVSYQYPEDSVDINCSPSYTLLTSGGNSVMQQYIDEGYYLNYPDYEGPKSMYTVGVQAGRATLDSLRVVMNSANFSGISPKAKIVIHGYSGGSIATGWAAELQNDYARDLNIVGAAVGGFVANGTAVGININGGEFAGFLAASLVGLAEQFPVINETSMKYLNKTMYYKLLEAKSLCLVPLLAKYAYQDIWSYFSIGEKIITLNSTKEIEKEELVLGANAPIVPMYVYNGIQDQIVPIEVVDKIVTTYCSAGVNIQYVKNATANHINEEGDGFPGALSWIKERLDGTNAPTGCVTTTISGNTTTATSFSFAINSATVKTSGTVAKSSAKSSAFSGHTTIPSVSSFIHSSSLGTTTTMKSTTIPLVPSANAGYQLNVFKNALYLSIPVVLLITIL